MNRAALALRPAQDVLMPAAVFTDHASERVSPRYVHVDSRPIVEAMQAEGFQLFSANSMRKRLASRAMYAKHALDFRHPDLPEADGYVPRVIFVNSHDGSSSAKFMMGVYRFVCENGLVVGSSYAHEVARHSGEAAADLVARVQRLARNTAPLFAQIDKWTRRQLSGPEVTEFARLAATLRFGDAQRFNPAQLLEVARPEDEGGSLWRVFNRVQENAVRGGLVGYSATGRQLASRRMNGMSAHTDFNVQLWRLAEEFAD